MNKLKQRENSNTRSIENQAKLTVFTDKIKEARKAVKNSAVASQYKKLWKQKHRRILSQILDDAENTEMAESFQKANIGDLNSVSNNSDLNRVRAYSISSPTKKELSNALDEQPTLKTSWANNGESSVSNIDVYLLSPENSSDVKSKEVSGNCNSANVLKSKKAMVELVNELNSKDLSNEQMVKSKVIEKPRKLYKSLKEVIKEANKNFIEALEDTYAAENPKTTLVAPKLAKLYIQGRRTTKNHKRAFDLLSASSLSESKFFLMKMVYEYKFYTDVFYFNQFLKISKWSWPSDHGKFEKKKSLTKSSNFKMPIKGFTVLEDAQGKWFKHEAEDIVEKVVNLIGEAEGKKLEKEATNSSYLPQWISYFK
jgi:hypothetical protein